jgi:hypothetical protein
MLRVRSRFIYLFIFEIVNGAVLWSFVLVDGIVKCRLCLCSQLSMNFFGH